MPLSTLLQHEQSSLLSRQGLARLQPVQQMQLGSATQGDGLPDLQSVVVYFWAHGVAA